MVDKISGANKAKGNSTAVDEPLEPLLDDDHGQEDDEEGEDQPRPENTEWYVIHSYSGYENKVKKKPPPSY
jgi:hypothetical protein